MENCSVYEDIANRTGGDIYIGVVGPVRTGKSTFIKRFMETLVIPSASATDRAVMVDELPQSAAGKTVMTTEPKFVPAKAARVAFGKNAEASVRLVDCVGFAVAGASGFEEEGAPRLVKTPWREEAMPFEQAAELGTEKVIKEHSTIGVLVTTDGSITDLPRENYLAAEERAVRELKAINKPFVILLNCKDPASQMGLCRQLEKQYEAPVVAMNVEKMGEEEIAIILQKVLFEFPVTRIDVHMPKWLQTFAEEEGAVAELLSAVKMASSKIEKMRDCSILENLFDEDSDYVNPNSIQLDPGTGKMQIFIDAKPQLFYRVLGETCGEKLDDDLALMQYLKEISGVKKAYDKVKEALKSAEESGYGIVYPDETEYALETPRLVKKGASYGVEFKAKASGYHIVKVEVKGEVSPIIGTKEQGEEFVQSTVQAYEEGQEKVWETNIFGKSLRELVGDDLAQKSGAMPVELRRKMRRVVTRVVNEGKSNLLCILF